MTSPLGELPVDQFLSDYWQKRPCLIRNALPGFVPPLDADDIAGLACEEMAESRLVSGSFPEHDWNLRHGPFDEEEFAGLPESHWTLLVQDVEKHYPPLQELMARFDFLPTWRLDDLMVSYAVPGGSVGPHVDQYDVFLYQASGQRLWQIAEDFNPTLLKDTPLNVLHEFEPQREWLLKPGDMLYLPPNVAHHGVAVDEGMTWSIGLRAPSAADLLLALGETLGSRDDQGPRYADPDLVRPQRSGEIDASALKRMRRLLSDSFRDEATFSQFMGAFATSYRLAHEPVSPDHEMNAASLMAKLQSGSQLFRNPWTRLAWIKTPGGALLFAAGTAMECSVSTAEELCSNPCPLLFSKPIDQRDTDAIISLVNGGHLVLTRE